MVLFVIEMVTSHMSNQGALIDMRHEYEEISFHGARAFPAPLSSSKTTLTE